MIKIEIEIDSKDEFLYGDLQDKVKALVDEARANFMVSPTTTTSFTFNPNK